MRSGRATLDHLVVAADTLEQGEDHLASLLGVRPRRGGRHRAMGTHNSLLKLGERCYLELIAIDPDAASPARPRWFDLDRPAMRALLAQRPRLIHWVARTDDIEAARLTCPIDPGPVHAMSRGDFGWRITIPDDGSRPGAGVLPTLIQWDDARHPADDMPDAGVLVAALAAAHPEPGSMRAVLAALALSDTLKVTFDAAPRLAAMLSTRRGTVTL
ncbi:MAG: VOC family protein [Betaproteobacteria bacterium]